MLRGELIHPDILRVVAAAGHHARILIADGNYPGSSKRGPDAEVVYLNLAPGVVTCNQVLAALLTAVPIEAINTMQYATDGPYGLSEDPPVWSEYEQTLSDAGVELALQPVEKWAFYEQVMSPDHVLTIQTADQQTWANVLLTVGAINPA
ncbi:RbsD/FucU family protein [Phycisphaeraceae bacterium D3-23]